MTGRDFYQVLGIARDASPADIRAAYARLVRRHHPDMAGELPGRLNDIQRAYRCLSDADARAAHDRVIAAEERAHADRQRRVRRQLHGYDHRHPRPRPRPRRRWRQLAFAMAGLAIATGVSLTWFV